MASQASPIQGDQTQGDLTLKVICSELGSIKTKSHQIGVQLGIPNNKLQELKRDDDPLSAIVNYWLQGNVPESHSTISWISIVEALKSHHVGESGLAEQIRMKYCQQKEEITPATHGTDLGDTSAKTSEQSSSDPNSKLHPDVRMDLKFNLDKNLKAISKKYASYTSCLCERIIEKGVTPAALTTYLLSIVATSKTCEGQQLTLLSDKKEELERCTTINAIFNILLTQCSATFMNYEIFQSMLDNFGISEDQEKLKYSEHLEAYVKKHTISEFTKVNPLLKTRKNSKDFTVKFDIETTCRLAEVTELKIILAEILDINPSALEIVDIEDGCVIVKFLIPGSLADAFFTSDTEFTVQQDIDLQAAKVLWLECNGHTFHIRQKSKAYKEIEELEKLDDQLTCPICLDNYENPRQLLCNHIYCQHCLVRLVVRDQQGQLRLPCPNCRKVTPVPANGVAGLQPAFQVNHLLNILEEHRKKSAAHPGQVKLASSKPTYITVACLEHKEKEVNLYCETCAETICWICITKGEKHHGHNFTELNKAFERYKVEITPSLEATEKQLVNIKRALAQLDTSCEEIANQQATMEANIHHTIGRLHQTLDIRKTELIGQLHRLTQDKLKSLAAQRDQIETNQAKLTSYLKFMRENLKTGNHRYILSMQKKMKKPTTTDMLEPNTKADMIFSALNDLSIKCRNYGKIYAKKSVPDPTKCWVICKGVAAVGEKSTLLLRALNHSSMPCKAFISCKLVSEITGTRTRGSVEQRAQGQYEISYQPIIKGRHQLHIKVEGQHIRGSPFPINVRSPVMMLSTPILTIGGVKGVIGVAVNHKGDIVVTECAEHCVSVFSSSGERLRSFGKCGFGLGQFQHPIGVAIDTEQNIFVADNGNHRIQKFSAKGEFLTAVGTRGDGPLKFDRPTGIVFNVANGKIYVAESGNDRIQILNTDLSYFSEFGKSGTGNGQFNDPNHLACDKYGNIYIADGRNHRIQVFTAKGVFLRTLGRFGKNPGELDRPYGIDVDCQRVYVSEYWNHRVSVFTSEGRFLTSFGSHKSGLEEFTHPRGLAVVSGVVYVCVQDLNCVKVF